MKLQTLGLTLALATAPLTASAGKVEADFNDLYAGDTRTRGNSVSLNDGKLNTGTGFTPANASATGGSGEYNNNTGVVQFDRGDLVPPSGVTNFNTEQGSAVDPSATGQGIVFSSSREIIGRDDRYRRFQERSIATPLTGSQIWFSFLFRLEGPNAEGRILFNKPSTENSSDAAASAFAIALGHPDQPGRVAIDTSGVFIDGAIPVLSTPGTFIDGIETGNVSLAGLTSHVAIGRIVYNSGANSTIELWIDPADAQNLGSPDITVTDNIGSSGITSIGFEGVRRATPAPAAGPYTSGGRFLLDHFRMSDEANAQDFITGNVVVDPKLVIDTLSPATSFNFRGVYGSSSPVTAAPLTVRLKNDGVNNPITINSVNFQNAQPGTPVFTINSTPVENLVLLPGQTVDVTVQASASTFETAFTNNIVVDTDTPEQDMLIGVGATFYTGGSRTTANPSFELNLDGWINDAYGSDNTPPQHVAPGFLGSAGMVRLRGVGDNQGGFPDNFSQTLLNGAADWEFTFAFSPVDAASFSTYTDGAEPGPIDRTFQVVLQSNGNIPTPAAATGGRFTDTVNGNAALINLAYLPSGEGFCVFNGSTWEPVGLPMINGSIDTNRNGLLRSSEGDTVNYYVVRIKGTGFGTGAAKYSITLSQANSSAPQATVSDLAIWSSHQGTSHTPGAYTFTTGDTSSSGRISESNCLTTPFWVDEAAFYSFQVRDPAITSGGAVSIVSHNGTTVSGSVPITNTGFTQNLVINPVSFGKPTIFSTPATLPVEIPPGTTVQIPVNIDGANIPAPNNAEFTNMTLTTNIGLQPTLVIPIYGGATTDLNLVPNWNFELAGADPGSDFDSFALWEELGTANASRDVPGLVDGSTKAVHLASGSAVRNTFGAPVGNFMIEMPFAVRDTTVRAFNLNLHGTAGPNNAALNIRYEASKWEVYSTTWNTIIDMTANPLSPSIDANGNLSLNDAGDTKNIYKIRLTGLGWDTATPTYQLEILDAAGGVVASSAANLAIFQGGTPTGGALYYTLSANASTNAGFWADDVLVYNTTASPEVRITGFSGGPGEFIIYWNSGGVPVTVERSTTLLEGSWEPLVTGNTGNVAVDFNAPQGRAFYRVRID